MLGGSEFFDLFEAVFEGNFPRIRELLDRGTDINCRDSYGRTVLHHLAQNCLQGEIIWNTAIPNLVLLGGNINARDITGMSPLHYALCLCKYVTEQFKLEYKTTGRWHAVMHLGEEAKERELNNAIERMQIGAVESLVKLGADINAKFEHEVNSIHRAVKAKNTRCLEFLASRIARTEVNVRTCANFTALNLAICYRKLALTKRLIELGADKNSSYSIIRPIHRAVGTGRLEEVRILVENGADVGAVRWDSITPIVQAFAIVKDNEMFQCLARLGSALNANISQRSIVCEAIKSGNVDILEYLVNARPALIEVGSCIGEVRETVLGIAVGEQNYKAVELILRNGADVNVAFDYVPQLVFAMRLGHMGMVKALVKLGVDVDHMIYTANRTSLYQALVTDQPEMLRLLLRHGGDINRKYNVAENLIHLAVAKSDEQVVRVLAELGTDLDVEKYEAMNLLHYALQKSCSMDLVEVLVEEGISLNQGYNERVTALHDAVIQGNTAMVRILGELNADMNYGRLEGLTPLHQTISTGRCDVIRYLVSRGADMSVRCFFSVKPLHDAVRLGNIDIVHSLVASGAGIEPDRARISVLHWAVYYEMNEAAKCLLECGTNANETSSLFITPLHDAVDRSDLSMVITLVNLGARNIKTTEETVLNQCIEKDMYSTTETLLKFGADKNVRSGGYSPIDSAIRKNNYGCVAVLSRLGVGYRYREGLSFLHRACELGHIDLARLLIIEGGDVNSLDSPRKKEPLEYLPLVDAVDYHVLKGASTAEKTIEKVAERFVSVADIPNMTAALHTPGIGDVRYILKPRSKEISERAFKIIDAATKRNKTSTGKPFHMRAIGSAAEGTRVGLPNEMDLLFEMPIEEDKKIVDLGNGYVHYDYAAQRFIKFMDKDSRFSALVCGQDPSRDIRGSAGFHYETGIGYFNLQTSPCTDEKVSIVKRDTHVHPNDRKACSILVLQWDDGLSRFRIPVDLVPSLHVDDWPVGAVTRTWLMDEQD